MTGARFFLYVFKTKSGSGTHHIVVAVLLRHPRCPYSAPKVIQHTASTPANASRPLVLTSASGLKYQAPQHSHAGVLLTLPAHTLPAHRRLQLPAHPPCILQHRLRPASGAPGRPSSCPSGCPSVTRLGHSAGSRSVSYLNRRAPSPRPPPPPIGLGVGFGLGLGLRSGYGYG